MSSSLAGVVAVVTGGSRGLGRAISELLGRAGASIVIGALPGDGVEAAVEELRAAGITAVGVEVDISDRAQVELLARTASAQGPLGIWVNNAGASGVYGPAIDLDPEVFERVVNANMRGVFHGTQVAAREMAKNGRGHIVNVWGKGFDRPVPWQAAYATSKAWNAIFTRTMRRELAGTGVQVHGFDPGLVKTEMISQVHVAAGFEERVRALPVVVALWGQDPDVAARPVLGLVTGRRRDHRALALPRALGRAVTSVARGNLKRERRIVLDLTVVERGVVQGIQDGTHAP